MAVQQNMIMFVKGKEIPFNVTDDEFERIFQYMKVEMGCYEGKTFEQVIEEAE